MYKRNISKPFRRWTNAAFALLAVFSLSLAGCGGGSVSATTDTGPGDGQAIISLTDAAGDFLTYTVDVVSLTLTDEDGTVVSTLPLRTRVDFTQLADLTEFLTGASVPPGNYKSVSMQLDYTNADIEVDDGTGTGFPAVSVRDRNGNTLSTLDVAVNLDSNHPLVIASGLPSQLALDFDLAASNEVDVTVPSAPIVTVDPVLSASLSFDQTKQHRVRGSLDSVDTTAGTFTLNLRPFQLTQGNFGQVSITTDADTIFEIDQVDYQGSAGLIQLAAEPSTTAMLAVVTPNGSGQLVASEVYAGSSVSFGSLDVVTGNVTKRVGDTLFIRGAKLVQTDGTLSFHDTALIQLGLTTKVTAQTVVGENLDIDNISVGQRITALGLWSTNTSTLDTTIPTKGLVRMMLTQLNGSAVTVSAPLLTMSVNRIDGQPASLFDFTSTGTPIADASNYAVNVPNSIDLSGINFSTPLKVRGFVRPFGLATAVNDFDASTLIDVSAGPADLVIHWPIAGQAGNPVAPFGNNTSTGMDVNLSRAGLIHDVYRSGIDTQLDKTTVTPTVNAQDPAQGLFVISYHGTVQVYTKLSDFKTAAQNGLAAGQLARSFAAHGTYDDASTTMTATRMFLLLK